MSRYNSSSPNPSSVPLSTWEVIPLATYTTAGAIAGILGNILVLYSSLRYNSIKLDEVSVLFIQNIAAADLLYIFLNVLPVAVTLIAGQYVLGQVYCFVSAQLSFVPAALNVFSILVLTLYRFHLIRSPFQQISLRSAKCIMFLVHVLSTFISVSSLAYKSDSIFVPKYAKCVSTIYFNKDATLFRITSIVILFVPITLITITNAILCVISLRKFRQHSSESRRSFRPLTTVCLLSGIFNISWMPYLCSVLVRDVRGEVPVFAALFAYACIQINSFSNPVLYTLTNKRFGRYVRDVVRGLLISEWSGGENHQSRSRDRNIYSASTTNTVEIQQTRT